MGTYATGPLRVGILPRYFGIPIVSTIGGTICGAVVSDRGECLGTLGVAAHTLPVKGVSPEIVMFPIAVRFFRGATMGDPILAAANVTLRCDGKAIRAFSALLLGQLSGGVTLGVFCTMLLGDVNPIETLTPTVAFSLTRIRQ